MSLNYKPRSANYVEENEIKVILSQLEGHIKHWMGLIEEYESTNSIYDDPILKASEEYFAEELKIVDKDADVAPFDLPRQILIDGFLDKSIKKIEELKPEISDDEGMDGLIEEAYEIKNNLSKETKRKVIQRLCTFFAKAQKIGLPVIKEVFVNVFSEIVTKVLTGG